MRRSIPVHCLLWLSVLLFLLAGCSKEEEHADDAAASYGSKQIIVLFSPGGVGDMGYNDQILRGIQRVKEERQFPFLFASPNNLQEAERIFSDWLHMEGVKGNCLFILAGNEYEPMARQYLQDGSFPDKQVLLFETTDQTLPINTFSISMYGACYLAGATAHTLADKAAIIVGNSNDATILQAAEGFADGFHEYGGEECHTTFLADNWTGYTIPDSAYKVTAALAQDFSYIFPIAGGSNLGVYRYTREYPDNIFTAGMDVDQSGYSTQVTCSVVKHIDRLIEDYLNLWLDNQPLPSHKAYGLESGYIEAVIAPLYQETLQPVVDALQEEAINKENEILLMYQ